MISFQRSGEERALSQCEARLVLKPRSLSSSWLHWGVFSALLRPESLSVGRVFLDTVTLYTVSRNCKVGFRATGKGPSTNVLT